MKPLAALRLRGCSDEQLVARFRAGDDAAYAQIADRYRDRLRRYARNMLRTRSADVAEDVVQDVFLRAFSALRRNDREMLLRPWLYRAAHNRCIDELRRPANAELAEVHLGTDASAAEVARGRMVLADLVSDIDSLPDQQRSALIIRELDGLGYEEIADALGVTVPAVKSLLVRARMGLAEAAEARAADCGEIRRRHAEHGRRPAIVRGHLRVCDNCRLVLEPRHAPRARPVTA